ncbi:MAG: hypothetical protein AAB955_00770 [Patescibacteria group bacterium]
MSEPFEVGGDGKNPVEEADKLLFKSEFMATNRHQAFRDREAGISLMRRAAAGLIVAAVLTSIALRMSV